MAETIRHPPRRTHALTYDIEAAVSAFLAYCRSKNLSPKTVDYYAARLLAFTRYASSCPPTDITAATIREFLTHEKETNSAATANHSLCTLRVFLGFLHAEGFLESNPAASVTRLKAKKRVIETFSPEQIEAVLRTCGRDFYGVRDRAVILTLLDCGLRASELCALQLADVNRQEQSFRVEGKGAKERIVPFGQGVRRALASYLAIRTESLPARSLFVTQYGEPLTRYRLRDLVKRRCNRAGIEGVRPSPHTLRHTCAVSYLRSGGDTFTLQMLLGHTSQDMTRRYCESLLAADVQRKHRDFSPVDNMKGIVPKSGRRRLG